MSSEEKSKNDDQESNVSSEEKNSSEQTPASLFPENSIYDLAPIVIPENVRLGPSPSDEDSDSEDDKSDDEPKQSESVAEGKTTADADSDANGDFKEASPASDQETQDAEIKTNGAEPAAKAEPGENGQSPSNGDDVSSLKAERKVLARKVRSTDDVAKLPARSEDPRIDRAREAQALIEQARREQISETESKPEQWTEHADTVLEHFGWSGKEGKGNKQAPPMPTAAQPTADAENDSQKSAPDSFPENSYFDLAPIVIPDSQRLTPSEDAKAPPKPPIGDKLSPIKFDKLKGIVKPPPPPPGPGLSARILPPREEAVPERKADESPAAEVKLDTVIEEVVPEAPEAEEAHPVSKAEPIEEETSANQEEESVSPQTPIAKIDHEESTEDGASQDSAETTTNQVATSTLEIETTEVEKEQGDERDTDDNEIIDQVSEQKEEEAEEKEEEEEEEAQSEQEAKPLEEEEKAVETSHGIDTAFGEAAELPSEDDDLAESIDGSHGPLKAPKKRLVRENEDGLITEDHTDETPQSKSEEESAPFSSPLDSPFDPNVGVATADIDQVDLSNQSVRLTQGLGGEDDEERWSLPDTQEPTNDGTQEVLDYLIAEDDDEDIAQEFRPTESIYELEPFVLPAQRLTEEAQEAAEPQEAQSPTKVEPDAKVEKRELPKPIQLQRPETLRKLPNITTDLPGLKPLKGGDPMVGAVLDNQYEILDVIGQGGMAIVYRARQLQTDKLVAIKTLKSPNPQDLIRFNQEIKTHSKLSHKNIVGYIESITSKGQLFMVMERVRGISLQEIIRTLGKLDDEENMADILIQILDALSYAHETGLIHRDLKTGNIILIKEEHNDLIVKILDFGIAKVQGDLQRLTHVGQALGSPIYMSPEQCSGKALTTRSDLYSLGVVAYEIMTGNPPYSKGTLINVMAAHCNENVRPKPLKETAPNLKKINIIDQILQKALQTDPAKRWQTAAEFKTALKFWVKAIKINAVENDLPVELMRCPITVTNIDHLFSQRDSIPVELREPVEGEALPAKVEPEKVETPIKVEKPAPVILPGWGSPASPPAQPTPETKPSPEAEEKPVSKTEWTGEPEPSGTWCTPMASWDTQKQEEEGEQEIRELTVVTDHSPKTDETAKLTESDPESQAIETETISQPESTASDAAKEEVDSETPEEDLQPPSSSKDDEVEAKIEDPKSSSPESDAETKPEKPPLEDPHTEVDLLPRSPWSTHQNMVGATQELPVRSRRDLTSTADKPDFKVRSRDLLSSPNDNKPVQPPRPTPPKAVPSEIVPPSPVNTFNRLSGLSLDEQKEINAITQTGSLKVAFSAGEPRTPGDTGTGFSAIAKAPSQEIDTSSRTNLRQRQKPQEPPSRTQQIISTIAIIIVTMIVTSGIWIGVMINTNKEMRSQVMQMFGMKKKKKKVIPEAVLEPQQEKPAQESVSEPATETAGSKPPAGVQSTNPDTTTETDSSSPGSSPESTSSPATQPAASDPGVTADTTDQKTADEVSSPKEDAEQPDSTAGSTP